MTVNGNPTSGAGRGLIGLFGRSAVSAWAQSDFFVHPSELDQVFDTKVGERLDAVFSDVYPSIAQLERAVGCRREDIALPTSAPPPSISPATTSDEPQDKKQYDRSYDGVDDQGNDPHPQMDVQLR
jgi:hypothetical protein